MTSLSIKEPGSMYFEFTSLNATGSSEEKRWSVLHKIPHINGQNVVYAVVKPMAASISGISSSGILSPDIHGHQPQNASYESDCTNYLRTDGDVSWIMEVICYGLSLPLTTTEQHEAVRDCVHIYCEWMYAMVPGSSKNKLIPFPILDDPNRYYRKMIQHLFNVFIPRGNLSGTSQDTQRQAVLCHRVLRTIECISEDETNIIDKDSWEALLLFLLAINDILLAPPAEKDDIGTNLCERVVSVLFEIWIICCRRCFPSPSYWKTFHELACTWRHRPSLIDHWSRVCLSLTQRLCQISSEIPDGATFDFVMESKIQSSNVFPTTYLASLLQDMNYEKVSQTWFRFLHLIANPVDLCSPEIISKTEKFLHHASECVIDPRQHHSLNVLPHNFYNAMKGLAYLVDTFLGFEVNADYVENETFKYNENSSSSISSATPPNSRKVGGSKPPLNSMKSSQKPGILSGLTSNKSGLSSTSSQMQRSSSPPLIPPQPYHTAVPLRNSSMSNSRPKVNSVLNALGNWLFSGALIGSELNCSSEQTEGNGIHRTSSSASFASNDSFGRKGSVGTSSDKISIEISSNLTYENFEAGQAEAAGALCRLLSSKRTDEDILPVYLARFYLALQHGLSNKEPLRIHVLANILLNSTRLFQLDLNGINILIPHFLRAMELIINDRDSKPKLPSHLSPIEVRRACISILLSLLCYPLHFNELPIKDCLLETANVMTFQSLRPRLVNLMIIALQTESDSINTQMLLGGFLTVVQDAAIFEDLNGHSIEIEVNCRIRQSPFTSETPSETSSSHFSASHDHHSYDSSLTSTDFPAANFSDAFLGRGGIPDTARGLFARTLYLVCHLLISNWKNDTHVSLAALEVLTGLARIKLFSCENERGVYNDECKRAAKWICDYIVNQCSRPPQSHSKDMHSTIVAAYQCLTVWFQEHYYLLQDKECISMLLEVIELGISGSKSKSKIKIIFKDEKELKPASMRVRDSAETLLSCLMNHFCQTDPCPTETMFGSISFDESSLLKHLGYGSSSHDDSYKKFKYFFSDNFLLLSVLNNTPSGMSACILRSPFGKFCWSMKFQVFPQKTIVTNYIEKIPRPVPFNNNRAVNNIVPHNFPDSVEKVFLSKLDSMVPTLNDIINTSTQSKNDHEKFLKILERQNTVENQMHNECLKNIKFTECEQQIPGNDVETARLILSHFGFLTSEAFDEPLVSQRSSLTILDDKNASLFQYLKDLDFISTRTSDAINIFYVRKGRLDSQEILNSVTSSHYVSQAFMDFLNSTGTPANVCENSAWTGIFPTLALKNDKNINLIDHGGCIYDGRKKILYWSDVSHELAFIVPSGVINEMGTDTESKQEGSEHLTDRRSMSSLSDDGTSTSSHSRNYSDTESKSSLKQKNKHSIINVSCCDTKILVIWLESIDDYDLVPIQSLISYSNSNSTSICKEYFVIFIHPLKNGLFRIRLKCSAGRTPFAIPLIDGIVISKRILGVFVRLTALNFSRRRRLDADNYYPPHVKRRLKIQETAKKFTLQLNKQYFYNSFFS